MASKGQRKAKLAARLFAQLRLSVELGLVIAMQDLTPRSFLVIAQRPCGLPGWAPHLELRGLLNNLIHSDQVTVAIRCGVLQASILF